MATEACIKKYLLVLLLGGLELPLDPDLERRDVCGLTGLSFSCFILTLDSRSGDSLLLCRFSLVILNYIHEFKRYVTKHTSSAAQKRESNKGKLRNVAITNFDCYARTTHFRIL